MQEADERRRQEDIREKAAQQKKDDADRVAREVCKKLLPVKTLLLRTSSLQHLPPEP